MAKSCPSCGHPVDDDANACPNCPASWETEEEAHYRLRHAPRFGLSSASGLGMLAVLAAAAILAAWKSLSFVLTWGGSESKSSPIAQFVDKRTPVSLPESPRVLGNAPAPAPSAPSEPAPEEGSDDGGVVMISHDHASPAKRWRFRGRVLDLQTLSPVSRCALDFSDPGTGTRYETSTDGDGLYRVELPPLESRGYSVRIHAGGYAPSYLDPAMENVSRLSAEERRGLVKGLEHSLDGPYTVQADSERPVPTDFYLAPAE